MSVVPYLVREELKPRNLVGISPDQIDDHWKLYAGYVAQVNTLTTELAALRATGGPVTLAYADRRRRYGFEYNGMVLHEYYFGNLKAGTPHLHTSYLLTRLVEAFGSYEIWKTDFENAAKSRSIGWAILYADTTTGDLANHFIEEHGNGNVAGFAPILVLDVWEHAYMVDHRAGGRGDYIAAFMQNIDWYAVEARYDAVLSRALSPRFVR